MSSAKQFYVAVYENLTLLLKNKLLESLPVFHPIIMKEPFPRPETLTNRVAFALPS